VKGKTSSVGCAKAQVSAEMIVLIAAVLAVAFILVTQMQATAQKGAAAVEKNANRVFGEINDTMGVGSTAKRNAGSACTADSQCKSGDCDDYTKKCV